MATQRKRARTPVQALSIAGGQASQAAASSSSSSSSSSSLSLGLDSFGSNLIVDADIVVPNVNTKSQEELLKDVHRVLSSAGATGMTQKQLESGLKSSGLASLTPTRLVELLNALLTTSHVSLSQDPATRELRYKAEGPEHVAQFKGLGVEEKLVYQLIKEAADKGIWIRNLKTRSGLQTLPMTKTLKALESRRLIKAVKTIANRSRKVYMLYELQPHRSLIGGPWVTDSEFDQPFFTQLQRLSYKYVNSIGCSSSLQVHEFIRSSGVSTVELDLEDTEILLATLIYDGQLEKMEDMRVEHIGGPALYKATKQQHNPFTLPSVPCGSCPVADQCHEDGEINPASCVYLSEWLDPGFGENLADED